MTQKNRPSPNPPSPTQVSRPEAFPPGLLDRDLTRLDARLTHELRQLPTPPGLADRVYEASAGHLPSRRLRLVGSDGRTLVRVSALRRQSWGRVALAASVLVGVGLAWNLLNRTAVPVAPDVAHVSDPGPDVIGADADGTVAPLRMALSPEAEGLLLEELAMTGRTDLSYLALTRELSYHDIADELASMIAGINEEGGM